MLEEKLVASPNQKPCTDRGADADVAERRQEARLARMETDPLTRNAEAAAQFSFQCKIGNIGAPELIAALTQLVESARSGTEYLERTLLAQANVLDAMFASLIRRAASDGTFDARSTEMMRLALKAQNQCRSTLEAVATIKNPTSTLFARQANFAQGHQQINNGAVPQVTRGRNPPTELLENDHGERLDTSKTSTAVRADPVMAPVGAVHWTKVTGG